VRVIGKEAGMDLDDLKPKKILGPTFGETLEPLSLADLEARLALIDVERKRIETEIEARKASRRAAEGFFKS
jgi:uncharacterized small protein (DUF1192 family)